MIKGSGYGQKKRLGDEVRLLALLGFMTLVIVGFGVKASLVNQMSSSVIQD